MAKKITEDSIKKLIEEVLNEEQLNEKTYNIKGWKNTSGNTFPDLDDTRISKIRGTGKVVKKGTLRPAYLAAAGQDGKPELTPDDLPGAAAILNTDVETDPSKYGGSTGGGSAAFPHGEIVDSSGKLNPSLTKADNKSPSKPKIRALLKKYAQDSNTTAATATALISQLATAFSGTTYGTYFDSKINDLKSIGSGGLNLGTAKKSATAIQDVIGGAISALQAEPTDLSQAAGKLGSPEGPFGDPTTMGYQTQIDTGQTSDLSDADTEQVTRMMDKITVPMNELLKAQVMRRKTDKTTFAVGKTEISSLADFADEFETVANAMQPKNKGKLKKLTEDQSLMLMTKMSYVASLFGIAKRMPQGQEAGYVWEKMSALFLGGVVAGKKGEAADVIANLYGGTSISQKFIQGDVKQAAKNITNLMSKKQVGESVYYLALIKGGGSSAAGLDKIYFALIQLKKVAPQIGGSFSISYYDKNGSFKQIKAKTNAGTKKNDDFTIFKSSAYINKLPVLEPKIPADLNFEETVAQLSDNLSKPGGSFGELAKSTMAIASKLSEMQNITNEYRNARASQAAGGVASGNTPAQYVDKVSDTYISIKADYKQLFTTLNDYIGTKAATTFQEGKKITSNFLKKLIEESFKK